MSDLLIDSDEMQAVDKNLQEGIPRELALQAAGISKERMHSISGRAREGEEPYKTWLETLDQAEAKAKVKHLLTLATSPDWRARNKVLDLLDPGLLTGAESEYQKTYDWMLSVISEETDEETFTRILDRFATSGPGAEVESSSSEEAEG